MIFLNHRSEHVVQLPKGETSRKYFLPPVHASLGQGDKGKADVWPLREGNTQGLLGLAKEMGTGKIFKCCRSPSRAQLAHFDLVHMCLSQGADHLARGPGSLRLQVGSALLPEGSAGRYYTVAGIHPSSFLLLFFFSLSLLLFKCSCSFLFKKKYLFGHIRS